MPNYGQATPAPVYGQVPSTDANLAPYPPVPMGITAPATFAGALSGARLVLATWSKRAVGAIVDWVPVAVLGIVGSVLGIPWLASVLSLIGVVYGLVNVGYLGGTTGVSLGRRLAGTKLVREETLQPIGAGLGIGRYFLHYIDMAILCVGFLFPLWTAKKQTIADMIVKTIVIEDGPSRY